MLAFDDVDCGSNNTPKFLHRIAAALECTVDDFSKSSFDRDAQAAELMQLWLMIQHEQDRLKVLSFVRTIASESDAQQNR